MLNLLTNFIPAFARPESNVCVEDRRVKDQDLAGLASLDYYERLTKFCRDSTRHWVEESTTVVDYRPLFAATIHHLQRELAQEIQNFSKITITDEQLHHIRQLLEQYSTRLLS
jgi:hypothetical protein